MSETRTSQHIHVPLQSPEQVHNTLQSILGNVTSSESLSSPTFSLLQDSVRVSIPTTDATITTTTATSTSTTPVDISTPDNSPAWPSTALADAIALSLLNSSNSSNSSNSNTNSSNSSNSNSNKTTHSSHDIAAELLQAQFGPSFDRASGTIAAGKHRTVVDLATLTVTSSDSGSGPLRGRVESVLAVGRTLASPLC